MTLHWGCLIGAFLAAVIVALAAYRIGLRRGIRSALATRWVDNITEAAGLPKRR